MRMYLTVTGCVAQLFSRWKYSAQILVEIAPKKLQIKKSSKDQHFQKLNA